MTAYRIRALVLRKTRLGEADIILTLLAGEGTIVRAVAKGMRKPTSRFAGRLEPGSVVDLLLAPGRTLEVVSDVRSVDLHPGLRDEYER
ncbi:MAG TPA: recombination protein O N-terminal domain-containing protein, partial [Coriobacteriia bacterium]|nr:recombination protein O N-terminal domain-containing protein [Coriobacteriia bacterium]